MPQPQQPQTKRQNPIANLVPQVLSSASPMRPAAPQPAPAAHQAPPPSKWDLLTTQFGKAVGSPGVTYALQHPVQAIEDKVKDLPAVAKSLPGKVSALHEAIDNIPSNMIKGTPGAIRNLVAHAKEAKNQWQHGDHGAAATTLLQGAPLVGNTLGHLSDATQAAYQDSKERVKEANDMRRQGLYGGAAVNMLEATPLLGGYIEHQMDNYDSRDTAGNNAARLGGYLGGTLTNMRSEERRVGKECLE